MGDDVEERRRLDGRDLDGRGGCGAGDRRPHGDTTGGEEFAEDSGSIERRIARRHPRAETPVENGWPGHEVLVHRQRRKGAGLVGDDEPLGPRSGSLAVEVALVSDHRSGDRSDSGGDDRVGQGFETGPRSALGFGVLRPPGVDGEEGVTPADQVQVAGHDSVHSPDVGSHGGPEASLGIEQLECRPSGNELLIRCRHQRQGVLVEYTAAVGYDQTRPSRRRGNDGVERRRQRCLRDGCLKGLGDAAGREHWGRELAVIDHGFEPGLVDVRRVRTVPRHEREHDESDEWPPAAQRATGPGDGRASGRGHEDETSAGVRPPDMAGSLAGC